MNAHYPYILRRPRRSGFTLIEVVIALSIFAGIMALVSLFSWDVAKFSLQLQQDLDAQQEVSTAIQNFGLDLRAVGLSANGGYGVETAVTSSFIFYSDVDANGVTDRVRYFIGTSTVNRGVIRPTGTPAVYLTSTELVNSVIHDVVLASSSFFSYFDSNYTGAEASMTIPIVIANIRIVRFGVVVDKQMGSTPGPLASSISVALRNLKSN